MGDAAHASQPGTTRMRREIGQIPASCPASWPPPRTTCGRLLPRPRRTTALRRDRRAQHLRPCRQLRPVPDGEPPRPADRPGQALVTTIYERPLRWKGGLLLAISQSGESPDIVAVVSAARAGGALTVAITNHPDSPLGEAAEHVLPCRAGRELAIPATKTYVAQLVVVAALVEAIRPSTDPTAWPPARHPARHAAHHRPLAGGRGRSGITGRGSGGACLRQGQSRPGRVARVQPGHALELALKFKETCGLFAEAYSTADFAHGPVVLARPRIPVLAIRPDGPMGALVDATLQQTGHAAGCRSSSAVRRPAARMAP